MLKSMCCSLLIAAMASCGASADKKADTAAPDSVPVAAEAAVVENTDDASALINTVYEKFVFAIDMDESVTPETYFTANALKKLQADYEFDCDEGPCYAYNALRTDMQDSNPDSDESSRIESIEPDGEGWYIVTYSDMGWPGKTKIKVTDNKIDDYHRL